MNLNVVNFVNALGKRLNEKPNEPTSMELSSEMAHDLYDYLIDRQAQEFKKEKYAVPTVDQVIDALRDAVNHQGTPLDPHMMVWAEYWLKYAKNNCQDPNHRL